MPTLPSTDDLAGIAMVALLLGVRHGFDADHLAAIDGLTRCNARDRPALARSAGALFSLGHGLVVMLVALGASKAASAWHLPAWLDAVGAWTSIAVLFGLAAANVVVALRAGSHRIVTPVGWRTGVCGRLLGVRHPAALMAVGALFAVSFDTFGLATLFALAARRLGGDFTAASLAAVFVAGMLVADGANGLWISRLIRRSDAAACIASRVMTLTVAGVGLLTAGMGVALQTSEHTQVWAEGKESWFGAAVIGVVAVSYAIAQQLARPGRARLVDEGGVH